VNAMTIITAALCLASTIAGVASMTWLGRCAGRRRHGQSGSTTLEFTLAFPSFLVSVFTAAQTALLMHAQVIIDYAAFAAARSASVWIADVATSERLDHSTQADEPRARVLRAATLGTVAISPNVRQLAGFHVSRPPAGLGAAVRESASAGPAPQPSVATLTQDVVERWPYASAYTAVLIQASGLAGCRGTDPRVTVTVEHKYRMPVPFVGPALARMLGGGRLGAVPGEYYTPLTATYSMRRWACDREI
jgi:Flp pilus assembly protein TadG